MKRVILHCDCNSFFASVEAALNPAYRNVPMAVCGSQEDRHGIVLAKNELAKKFNIKTAETVFSAKKKCPQLVIATPHYDKYSEFSKRVNAIYARYTDMIEPFGIDESWLDVTASRKLFGSGEEIAERIRKEVKEEIGITVSIGVSFNKVFAKFGSDYKKPDAITVITEENFKDIIYPFPVSDLLFVGQKTAKALLSMGVRTIGDLAQTSKELLEMRFGKNGELLYNYSRGLDNSPVVKSLDDQKSISNGFTFRHDLVSREECRIGIDYLSEDLGRKLRAYGQRCSTVSLSIKDEHLRFIQRQRPQVPPTDVAKEIARTAYSILVDEWTEGKPIRMITVSVSNLVRADSITEQISLFDCPEDDTHEKDKKRENAIDKIRQKYGAEAIINGAIIDTDLGIYSHKPDSKQTK